MELSNRAKNFLKASNRDPEWITSEKETRAYLNMLKLNDQDPIANTQVNYGGYELTINKRYNLKLNFISRYHIEKHKRIYTERIKDEVIIQFDNGELPQIFYISTQGIIYTKDEFDPRKIHFTYDCIEVKIEQYAFLNEYSYLTKYSSGNYHVYNFEKLKTELADFEFISECSDRFNFCCKNEQMIILISPWLQGSGQYITFYGTTNFSWKHIMKKLQEKAIIE